MLFRESNEKKEVVRTFLCNDISNPNSLPSEGSPVFQTLNSSALADLTRLEAEQV